MKTYKINESAFVAKAQQFKALEDASSYRNIYTRWEGNQSHTEIYPSTQATKVSAEAWFDADGNIEIVRI